MTTGRWMSDMAERGDSAPWVDSVFVRQTTCTVPLGGYEYRWHDALYQLFQMAAGEVNAISPVCRLPRSTPVMYRILLFLKT